MSHEIEGTIKLIEDTQTFSSGFTKREFVVTTEDRYPQDIKLEVVKEKCDGLDSFGIGSPVKVNFNIRGNEHNGRYYVNLQAWKIEATGGTHNTQPAPQQSTAAPADDIEEDVPF